LLSPLYTALRLSVPTGRVETSSKASSTPPISVKGAVPSTVDPQSKATDPVGAPLRLVLELTVAVRLTTCPKLEGFGAEVSEIWLLLVLVVPVEEVLRPLVFDEEVWSPEADTELGKVFCVGVCGTVGMRLLFASGSPKGCMLVAEAALKAEFGEEFGPVTKGLWKSGLLRLVCGLVGGTNDSPSPCGEAGAPRDSDPPAPL
jgi:hypothetical protein